jgi:hypothetical protein
MNNQQEASSIQNLFCHETLLVSGIYCSHHQELSAIHAAIGTFDAGYVAFRDKLNFGYLMHLVGYLYEDGILFSLQMVHWYRNVLEMRL